MYGTLSKYFAISFDNHFTNMIIGNNENQRIRQDCQLQVFNGGIKWQKYSSADNPVDVLLISTIFCNKMINAYFKPSS